MKQLALQHKAKTSRVVTEIRKKLDEYFKEMDDFVPGDEYEDPARILDELEDLLDTFSQEYIVTLKDEIKRVYSNDFVDMSVDAYNSNELWGALRNLQKALSGK